MKNKEVYELNADGWHMKLMTFIWGWDHNDFSHMCNYFWLSVFNVVFIIPILAIKLLGFIFLKVYKTIEKSLKAWDAHCERKAEKYWQKRLSIIETELEKGLESTFIAKMIDKWLSHNGKAGKEFYKLSYEQKHKIYSLKTKKNYKQYEEEEKQNIVKVTKQIEKKKRIANAAKYALAGLKLLGVFLSFGVLYLLYLLVLWLVTLDYSAIFAAIGIFLLKFVIIVLAAIIVVSLIIGLYKLVKFLFCKYGKYCIPCDERREKLVKFFSILGSGIAYPFVKMFYGIIFLIDIIIELKRNHCPAIEWKKNER